MSFKRADDDEPSFDAVNDIDPNVWWHLTEERVDDYEKEKFSNQLQVLGSKDANYEGETACFGVVGHHWQFQPAGENKDTGATRYALRCSATNLRQQLGLCWVEDDMGAKFRSRPCMVDSDGTDLQKWEVADWGNGTYRFTNAHNGTKYYMDVNPGNPMFMSPDIDPSVYQPAQRWLMTSVEKVNDGAYSTTFTNTPSSVVDATTTSGSPESTNSELPPIDSGSDDSGGGGLSAGAAAGIGIGAAVAVIGLAAAAFLFWRRRRRPALAGTNGNPVELDQQQGMGGPGGVGVAGAGYYDRSPKGGVNPSIDYSSSTSPHQDYYNPNNNNTTSPSTVGGYAHPGMGYSQSPPPPPPMHAPYQPHAHEMEGNMVHHELDSRSPSNPQEFPR